MNDEEIELEEYGEDESPLESKESDSSSELSIAGQLNAHEISIDLGRDIAKHDGEDKKTSDAGAMYTILETIYQRSKHPRNNRISFFDFAGESIYYVSHQIYLSPMTVYILVVDMSKEPDEKTPENKLTRFGSWTYKGISNHIINVVPVFFIEKIVTLLLKIAKNDVYEKCAFILFMLYIYIK